MKPIVIANDIFNCPLSRTVSALFSRRSILRADARESAAENIGEKARLSRLDTSSPSEVKTLTQRLTDRSF
jgi:hypothetical protein